MTNKPQMQLDLDYALKGFLSAARSKPNDYSDSHARAQLVKAIELFVSQPPTSIRPNIVCLCGSTRFSEAFQKANLEETLAGNIVLTIGCDMRADAELFADKSETELAEIKSRLDELHLRKIDMADEVLILNVGQYIGESTRRELRYAYKRDKKVRFLEPIELTQEGIDVLHRWGWEGD